MPISNASGVLWDGLALRLLDIQDRYTRNVVLEEFSPDAQSIEVEQSTRRVTPVADRKLGVVWERDRDGHAIVRGVVPLPSSDDSRLRNGDWLAGALEKATRSIIE
jgi:hypothetical protein